MSLVLVTAFWAVSAMSQQSRPEVSAKNQKLSDVRLEVSREAQRVGAASASELFAKLNDPAILASLSLTAEQASLVRKLDGVTRKIVESWVLRGLDSSTAAELAARLSERGVEARRRIIEPAELLVLQCILTTKQAGQIRLALGLDAPKEGEVVAKRGQTAKPTKAAPKGKSAAALSKEQIAD